jgi:membrane protein DedA with SNARE-associated domain
MGAGRMFGGIPWVQKNIESLVIALLIIPGLPTIYKVVQTWLQSRRERKADVQ